jgi:AraC-like DNA-binding protein
MNATELRRLSELRSLLEGFAARHAAQHIAGAPEELNRLRSILEQLTKALQIRDYISFREADFALHQTIVKLAKVPRLKAAWREAWDGLLSFHAQGFEDYFPDARVLAQEHEYLVEAIALGDPAAAEDAARSHVDAVWFRVAERSRANGDPSAAPHDDPNSDPLRRATAYIAFHLHTPVKLTEVASKVAFTSAGNLSRLFRQHYGLSFQAYLQKLRLEKAAELLVTTRLPIARIASRVGYHDVSRFGQHFKRHHGQTPSEWRKR